MKELEKTRRISISVVLFILVIIIALLAYERPKHIYAENTASTLTKLLTKDYFVDLSEINEPDFILIDIRNQFEFDKGHIDGAININTIELLNEKNSNIFKELEEGNKTVVLYGNNPDEANTPFILLYQLGYKNIKILSIDISYTQNKLITKSSIIEQSVADVNAFIDESRKKASLTSKPKSEVVKPLKKVVPLKKKKKMPAEGGC